MGGKNFGESKACLHFRASSGMLAKKTWQIVAIRQIRQSFLPAKVLFYTVLAMSCVQMAVLCDEAASSLTPFAFSTELGKKKEDTEG